MPTLQASHEGRIISRGLDTIDSVLGVLGLQATRWLYELIPDHGTRDLGTGAYGVAVLQSEPQEARHKQRPSSALPYRADVGVRYMARLRADNLYSDYRDTCVVSGLMVAALIDAAEGNQNGQGDQSWHWQRTNFRLTADNTHLMIEQRYTVWATLSLSL